MLACCIRRVDRIGVLLSRVCGDSLQTSSLLLSSCPITSRTMTMRAGNLVIVMHGCLMYDNAYDPIFLVGIPSLEDARSKSVEKKRQTIRSVEPDALPLHLKLSPNREVRRGRTGTTHAAIKTSWGDGPLGNAAHSSRATLAPPCKEVPRPASSRS